MRVMDREGARRADAAREEINAALPAVLPRLRRFCMAIAGSRDGGDDLCQEAIARALASAGQFTHGTRLDSWLMRIARNVHIDAIRRRRTRGTEVDIDQAAAVRGDDGRDITESRSDFERVRSAFATLPEEQRLLMLLVTVEGYSYQDAAEMLDIPIGTVMSRLSRARRSLDTQLHSPVAALS